MKVFAFDQKLDAQSPHGGDPKPRMSALPPESGHDKADERFGPIV